jgi:hypothetical protein
LRIFSLIAYTGFSESGNSCSLFILRNTGMQVSSAAN